MGPYVLRLHLCKRSQAGGAQGSPRACLQQERTTSASPSPARTPPPPGRGRAAELPTDLSKHQSHTEHRPGQPPVLTADRLRERRLRAGERLVTGNTLTLGPRGEHGCLALKWHQYEFTSRTSSHKTISYLRSRREGEFHCTQLYTPPWCGDGRLLSGQMGFAVGFRGPSLSPRTWAPGGSPPQGAPRPAQPLLWETVSSACPAACYRRCRRLNGAPLASPAGFRLGSYFNFEMLLPPVTQTW